MIVFPSCVSYLLAKLAFSSEYDAIGSLAASSLSSSVSSMLEAASTSLSNSAYLASLASISAFIKSSYSLSFSSALASSSVNLNGTPSRADMDCSSALLRSIERSAASMRPRKSSPLTTSFKISVTAFLMTLPFTGMASIPSSGHE